uniref:Uncharacterized protein n=1 Tax=viral metagenome TaxID=1070528 RepID=A0A6C0B7E8_9ZZZZ
MIKFDSSPHASRFQQQSTAEYIENERKDMINYVEKLYNLKNNFTLDNTRQFDNWLNEKLDDYEKYTLNTNIHRMVTSGIWIYDDMNFYDENIIGPDITGPNLSQFLYNLCNTNEKLPLGSPNKLPPSDISEIRKIADSHNVGMFGTASVLARMATRKLKNTYSSPPNVGGKKKTIRKTKRKIRKKYKKNRKTIRRLY